MSIPKETLLHAYRTMKTIREFEERVNAEIMNGQLPGFTHLYSGQEANTTSYLVSFAMKRPGVLLLPPGWDAILSQGSPPYPPAPFPFPPSIS